MLPLLLFIGIGDRHTQNILIKENTGDLVHIDFGIVFEQGKVLPTPEKIPFRLTRDIIDGMVSVYPYIRHIYHLC
jgi:ataxia telangiectasia mutated family protein